MRITSQMLNEATKKSGIQMQRKTLLDYVNDDNKGNTLFQVLNKNKINRDNATKLGTFEKLETASDRLLRQMAVFADDGEDSLFAKIDSEDKDEDKAELYNGIESMVESYNSILNALRTSTGTLDGYYRRMMLETAEDNKELFDKIGISVERDGSMSVDMGKLSSSDMEAVREAVGDKGTFSARMAMLASRVNDSAEANVDSLSSQYNSSGNSYFASNNRYDYRG